MSCFTARRVSTVALSMVLGASVSSAQPTVDPLAPIERSIAAAESNLREGELQIAESHYRSALVAGWMVVGALRVNEQRLADAREAFSRASVSGIDAEPALRALAVVQLQMGEATSAIGILTRLATAKPKDVDLHRLLAQALMA